MAAPVAINAHRRGENLLSRVRIPVNETLRSMEGFRPGKLPMSPRLRIRCERIITLVKNKCPPRRVLQRATFCVAVIDEPI